MFLRLQLIIIVPFFYYLESPHLWLNLCSLSGLHGWHDPDLHLRDLSL